MKAKVDNSRLYEHLGSAIPLHTLWKVFYPGSLLLLGQSWYISFLLKNILGIWVDPWILSVDLTSFKERAHTIVYFLVSSPSSLAIIPGTPKSEEEKDQVAYVAYSWRYFSWWARSINTVFWSFLSQRGANGDGVTSLTSNDVSYLVHKSV